MNSREDFIKSYWEGFNRLTNVTQEDFAAFYDAAKYSGYPTERGGSVYASEGKSIYTLIRILKPKRILEIGNLFGTSSNHILQAVDDNKTGEVVLLDIKESMDYSRLHNKKFQRVLDDSLHYLNAPLNFDVIIQDGSHLYADVKKEIELILKNNQAPVYYIWSHDYHNTTNPNIQVRKAWDEMRGNVDQFEPFKDSISPTGFLITKKIHN